MPQVTRYTAAGAHWHPRVEPNLKRWVGDAGRRSDVERATARKNECGRARPRNVVILIVDPPLRIAAESFTKSAHTVSELKRT